MVGRPGFSKKNNFTVTRDRKLLRSSIALILKKHLKKNIYIEGGGSRSKH